MSKKVTPDASAQHRPSKAVYDHDCSLADTASIMARHRLEQGEDARTVIPDIVRNVRGAYLDQDNTWTIWNAKCGEFITAKMAGELVGLAIAIGHARRRGKK